MWYQIGVLHLWKQKTFTMSVTKKTNYPKTIRFTSKKQMHAAKRLASKKNQSLNGYILSLLDREIELEKGSNESIKTNLQGF